MIGLTIGRGVFMANDKELREYAPGTGILETREQFEARRQAVRNNPNPTMHELAMVGMDGGVDDELLDQLLDQKLAEKEVERNKAIAEAVRKPEKE